MTECLVPLEPAPCARQESKPVAKTVPHVADAHRDQARRRQLDRQCDAVKAAADLADRLQLEAFTRIKRGLHRPRSLDEQLHSRRTRLSPTASDGTGHRCSAPTRSPSRDVATTLTASVRARIVSTSSADESKRCSQLSNTISKRRPDSAWVMLWVTAIPA